MTNGCKIILQGILPKKTKKYIVTYVTQYPNSQHTLCLNKEANSITSLTFLKQVTQKAKFETGTTEQTPAISPLCKSSRNWHCATDWSDLQVENNEVHMDHVRSDVGNKATGVPPSTAEPSYIRYSEGLSPIYPSVTERRGIVKPSFIIFKPNPSPVRHYTTAIRSFSYYRQLE